MKFLVVGLGGIGQRHVRNIRTLLGTSVEIMAFRVRRESPTLTDNLAVEAGVDLEERYALRVFDQLDGALAERPDAVLICNPTSLHLPVALEAARAGTGIFVEKPLSHRLDGTEELITLAEAKGLVGLVGYQLRFHPCLQRLQSLLDANAIGRVVGVRIEIGEYLPGWHTYEDYRQMYASRAGLGGGVVLSQIHELDYVYWLFGMPRRVFAVGGHLSRLEIDVEDTASLLLECVVDGRPIPVHVHQDFVQRPPTRTCEVIGDAGKIQVDLRANSITAYDEGGDVSEAAVFASFERNQLFMDEMSHFLGCLAGRETPVVTLRDGRRSLEIALAAKQSMDTGNVVDLDAGGVR